jgi:hypothetical protein
VPIGQIGQIGKSDRHWNRNARVPEMIVVTKFDTRWLATIRTAPRILASLAVFS